MTIPPQQDNEVRKGGKMNFCPTCQRILYFWRTRNRRCVSRCRGTQILQRLAEGLPDPILRELFPTLTPTDDQGCAPPPRRHRNAGCGQEGRPRPAPVPGRDHPACTGLPARRQLPPVHRRRLARQSRRSRRGSSSPRREAPGTGHPRHLSGQCTNNVAEYRALLIGLELALQQGCERLRFSLIPS